MSCGFHFFVFVVGRVSPLNKGGPLLGGALLATGAGEQQHTCGVVPQDFLLAGWGAPSGRPLKGLLFIITCSPPMPLVVHPYKAGGPPAGGGPCSPVEGPPG